MKHILTWLLLATVLVGVNSFADSTEEPSIIISHSEDKTTYEYTLNGKTVEIKVVPKHGPAYYLVPKDDANSFERTAQSRLVVPKWVIFSW